MCNDGVVYVKGNLNGSIPIRQWLLDQFCTTGYLIQKLVEQHEAINQIYDKSINTVRLVTIYERKHNNVIPFSAVLRIGAHGNVVDNWAQGGLLVGINLETGKLGAYGLYKHGKGTKTTSHPDTGFIFEGFKIPFFDEVIEQACSLHERLKEIAIIGWDIAITNNGPMFIEGNDNPEISLNQCACGGLKKKFEKYIN